ncbi:LolA family protein [Bacillus taeanensis]|uniref:Outer membrane lipoprotein carrier protein LolA n=1 Tax=Bacillus taeanensis TaxID=273032 RepID=A0A366XUP3_9BACI|nr:outer membrane lipoprotein carrier protein LolA [Bacillus taeanensis]RBW67844.1 outer membrane lipoprotein carrier protein LolA [Bacillus taeanensis]
MRKMRSVILILVVFLLALAGCGQKSQEDILGSLEEKWEKLDSYKAEATMTLETGDEPRIYQVEVWHKKPSYYRVKLQNADQEQSQIILRNDEGVFVLTPALNKSFRFQSEWPDNQSQVYLYESLINDILNDKERTFKVKEKEKDYTFTTKTNYQNKNLHEQEITLSGKTLAPEKVAIKDKDLNVLVTVEFKNVTFDHPFKEEDFDMQRNMTGAKLEIPTMAETDQQMEVMYPMYVPDGLVLSEEKELSVDGEEKVILSYTGDKSFTLIQQQARAAVETSTPVSMMYGEPVDLGFTIGVMNNQSISWMHKGMEFYLTSNNMDEDELAAVARSVQGMTVK